MNGWLPSLAAFASLSAAISAQAPMDKGRMGLPLTEVMRPWTGDLNGMAERRMIRVLTAYSKTQYFIDRGMPRGTAYDQGTLLEAHLNKKLASGNLKLAVQFVPVSRAELIPALVEGKGDIIMADLTVTPERAAVVEFVEPWIAGVEEIVVTGPNGPVIATVEDLSGKSVFVRASSSYYQSLQELNTRPTSAGSPPSS
jgi:ABC-type amino acid transport substrate-binding protein